MSNNAKNLIPKSSRKLYFDIGNTAIKISYLQDGEWTDPAIFPQGDLQDVLEWLADIRQEFDYFIISSVVQNKTKALINGLGNQKNYLIQTKHIPDHLLDYHSVDTLGIDRYLAGLGAWSLVKNECVVLDAGTACTIDYVNREGVFSGGVILPGISMLEQGIRNFAPALPSVDRSLPDRWPGKTTGECLQWGITGGFRDTIRGILNRYEQQGEFKLFLTGGDADFLDRLLEREARVDKLLIFRGMKYFVENFTGEHAD